MNAFSFFNSPVFVADAEFPRQARQVSRIRILGKINTVLAYACLMLVAGLAFYSFSGRPLSREFPAVPLSPANSERKIELARPLTDGNTAQIKNLFESAAPAAINAQADLSSRYKVVGIIIDRDSQAVLRDRQTGKSFFVHKGDRLGEVLVSGIQDGQVFLSSESRNWELKP